MLMFLKPLKLPSFWLPQNRERAGQLPPQQRAGGGKSGLTSGRWSEEKRLLDVLGKCFPYEAIGCEARALVGTVFRCLFGCGSWARCRGLRDLTKVLAHPSCLSSSQQSSGSNSGSHSRGVFCIFHFSDDSICCRVLCSLLGLRRVEVSSEALWHLLDFAFPKAYKEL